MFQTYCHGRSCTDLIDPRRTCKYTHEQCNSYPEFRALTVPPYNVKEQKAADKAYWAQGIIPPDRQPSKSSNGQDNRSPSKDYNKDNRSRFPSDNGKGKGRDKGKDKDGKGKKGRGKGGKRKGNAGAWYDDQWNSDQWNGAQSWKDDEVGFYDTNGTWWKR